jgi:hypothetical protein
MVKMVKIKSPPVEPSGAYFKQGYSFENMFPPLVSTRSGSKGQHLTDAISASNTGSPTILSIFGFVNRDYIIYFVLQKRQFYKNDWI